MREREREREFIHNDMRSSVFRNVLMLWGKKKKKKKPSKALLIMSNKIFPFIQLFLLLPLLILFSIGDFFFKQIFYIIISNFFFYLV